MQSGAVNQSNREEMMVKHIGTKALIAAISMAVSVPVAAHKLNQQHQHVQRQTAYGVNQQGHAVNNQLGDIIIWSPQPQTGYKNNSVQHARPEANYQRPQASANMQRQSATPNMQRQSASPNMQRQSNKANSYGKPKKKKKNHN